jgi:hypothetical protein
MSVFPLILFTYSIPSLPESKLVDRATPTFNPLYSYLAQSEGVPLFSLQSLTKRRMSANFIFNILNPFQRLQD